MQIMIIEIKSRENVTKRLNEEINLEYYSQSQHSGGRWGGMGVGVRAVVDQVLNPSTEVKV